MCGRFLPLAQFYKRTRRPSLQSRCKACTYEKHKEWRARNPDKMLASGKRSRAKHPRKVRDRYLREDHGINIEQYEALESAQSGRCAICKKTEDDKSHFTGRLKRLAVDHDHHTGALRGLLCAKCNRGIGMFLDDPKLLRAAAIYLELHRFGKLKLA